MKIIPTVSSKNTVVLDEMEIFLNDRVGILLPKRKAIKNVKYGDIWFRYLENFKSQNS